MLEEKIPGTIMNPTRSTLKGDIGLLLFVTFGLLFCHQVVSNKIDPRQDDPIVIGIVSALVAHEA